MSKYNYVSSVDNRPSTMFKDDYDKHSSLCTILVWIANELAETNRLKRLKLKYMDRGNKSQIYFSDNELEDKA